MGSWNIVTRNDGFKTLAESVIRCALRDMKNCNLSRSRYTACLFFLNETAKDLYTGLAPDMIREWENAEPLARQILDTQFIGYDPNKDRKKEIFK